jgi:peptide/nickel transport system substrate-binding protein
MMQRRTFLLATGAAVAAPLAIPAIARADAGKTLTFIPQTDLGVLDPGYSTAYVTRNHAFMIYDTLYGMDDQFRVQPQMVEGHTTDADAKLWRLTMREELHFHDGTPVLARDVVASLRRWGAHDAFGQALMAATDQLSAEGDRVVVFRLKRPFPLLPEALGKLPAYMPCIMPERLATLDTTKQLPELVGSGPFRFLPEERIQGARFVYARFPGYVPRTGAPNRTAGGKTALIERVQWTVIPDAATAAGALAAGEADWWESPTVDLLPLLQKNPQIEVELTDKTGLIGLMRFNQLNPPFDNPEIRRIILRSVSQATMMTAVAGTEPGAWEDGVGVFCPGTSMASTAGMEALTAPRDLERSRRELAAAGYKGERVVMLQATDYPSLSAMALVGADLLQKIGMTVDLQAMDWGTIQQRRIKKDPVDKGGWSIFYSFFSGMEVFNPASHQNIRGNGLAGPPGWPNSPVLEKLRADWFIAPDLATQQRICADIQRQVFIDVPYIPLGRFFQPTAHRRTVRNLQEGFPVFYGVQKA